MTARIITGDCREVLATMAANSIDACVTDPPYGLEFMGKDWDRLGDVGKTSHAGWKDGQPEKYNYPMQRATSKHASYSGSSNRKCARCQRWEWDYPDRKCVCAEPDFPNVKAHQAKIMQAWHEAWAREVYRVLKPGGHMLAFGGTRTHHRLMCAIEDAGFDIRDMPLFLYVFGSGFPKGRRVDNAIIQEARAWLSNERVPFVEQLSGSIHLPFDEGRASTALAAARIQPEGVPALLTETGRVDGSRDLTATLLSESQMEHIASNTTLSWSESSGVDFDQMKTSTIATASETTTILQILNSLPWPSTPDYTIEAEKLPSGCQLPVCVVVELLNGNGLGLTPIPALTALGNVTDNSAKRFDGFNVALKPAYEPIILARKPLVGSVAANVTAWGVGGLNIAATRIGTAEDLVSSNRIGHSGKTSPGYVFGPSPMHAEPSGLGRWPANLILDAESAALLDELSGERTSNSGSPFRRNTDKFRSVYSPFEGGLAERGYYGDSGGASRFFFIAKPDSESRLFYTAKASRRERNKGLAGMPERAAHLLTEAEISTASNRRCQQCGLVKFGQPHCQCDEPQWEETKGSKSANHHPTVKPVDLMQWLVRLITPTGGTVLDCFCGSGTTGIAADREGMHFIGIEQDPEYAEIARRRFIGDCPLFAEVTTT